MADIIREWGYKLFFTKLKMCGGDGLEFFRQLQIKKWNISESVSHCLKVYKDVLWMRLLEANEGMKLPNGCRMPIYIPFYSLAPNWYRFRSLLNHSGVEIVDMEEFLKSRPWEIHTFREERKNG